MQHRQIINLGFDTKMTITRYSSVCNLGALADNSAEAVDQLLILILVVKETKVQAYDLAIKVQNQFKCSI